MWRQEVKLTKSRAKSWWSFFDLDRNKVALFSRFVNFANETITFDKTMIWWIHQENLRWRRISLKAAQRQEITKERPCWWPEGMCLHKQTEKIAFLTENLKVSSDSGPYFTHLVRRSKQKCRSFWWPSCIQNVFKRSASARDVVPQPRKRQKWGRRNQYFLHLKNSKSQTRTAKLTDNKGKSAGMQLSR